MNEIRVCVFASQLFDGGEVTWTLSLIKSLNALENISNIDLLVNKDFNFFHKVLEREKIHKVKLIKVNWNFRFTKGYKAQFLRFLHYIKFPPISLIFNYKILNHYDICIFPYTAVEARYCSIPYVVTPQDIREKYNTQNKDGALDKIKLKLSYMNRKAILNNSKLIVVESDHVKNDTIEFYNVDENKIRVLVCPPSIETSIDQSRLDSVATKYKLPSSFLFYPAHFIKEKNHENLLIALNLLKEKFKLHINLILVGSKKNNFENVMQKIGELGLSQQVRYLGYVPDEDMPYLYKLATALVMPSLFESVSLPIWEAFYIGTPVLASNVCAIPEQVGDAGLIFDPLNPEDIAEKIYTVWTDKALRENLVNLGYNRIKNLTIENYAKEWDKIISQILNERRG